MSLQAISTVLSNRNSLRDDSKPSPLHSPQGQKSPFWITSQERQPFPHPIPENLKSEMFPFLRFTIFNSPFHSAVPPSTAQPLHPCQQLTRRFTSGLGLRFAVGTRPSRAWINSHKITKMCYNLPIIFNYVKMGRILWLNTRYTIVHMI